MRTTLASLCLLCLPGPALAQSKGADGHLWDQRQASQAVVGKAAMDATAAGYRCIPYHAGGSVSDGFYALAAADPRTDSKQLLLGALISNDWRGGCLVLAYHGPTDFVAPYPAGEATRMYALYGPAANRAAFKAAVKLP